jgi:protein associated with RNAse G/E
MNYKDIKDFKQRCKEQPVGYPAQMQAHLHEEIAELRNYIEWYLTPSHRTDFSKVKTITSDGKCIGWDGHEVNMAP